MIYSVAQRGRESSGMQIAAEESRKTRVCLIIDRMDTAGGPRYFEFLAHGLEAARFSVTLASDPASPLWGALSKDGLMLAPVPFPGPFSLGTLAVLKKLFAANSFDIVHSMGLRADVHTRLAAFLSRPRPRIVSTAAMLAQGFDVGPFRRRLYEAAEKWTSFLSDLILTDSEYTRRNLLRRYRLPAHLVRTSRIGTGMSDTEVSTGKIELRQMLGLPGHGLLIGSLGRLTRQKGHDVFLEAFALLRNKFPSLQALVVGDGPLKDSLEQRASGPDMGGMVHIRPARRDLANLLSALDILVIASRSESIPLLLYDAMAMARPIVSTPVGGIPEVLEDGVTGLIVPQEEPFALAAAIERLLADPQWAESLGRRARGNVAARFRITHCIRDVERIYENLLGGSA